MPRQRPRDDTYWRLVYPKVTTPNLRARLRDAGYKVKSGLTHDEMVDLLGRHDAGYLNYYKCSDVELQTFAINRGIVNKQAKQLTRRVLMVKLFDADANPAFTRFSELPAELRVKVHEYHMASFDGQALLWPVDPPLTRVSRLLRTEALPIFYSACTFRLNIVKVLRPKDGSEPMCWDHGTADYLNDRAREQIGLFRNLDLVYSLSRSSKKTVPKPLATGRLRMAPSGDKYTFELGDLQYIIRWYTDFISHGEFEWIAEEDVDKILKQVVKRPGLLKLTAEDMRKLCKSRVAFYATDRQP